MDRVEKKLINSHNPVCKGVNDNLGIGQGFREIQHPLIMTYEDGAVEVKGCNCKTSLSGQNGEFCRERRDLDEIQLSAYVCKYKK